MARVSNKNSRKELQDQVKVTKKDTSKKDTKSKKSKTVEATKVTKAEKSTKSAKASKVKKDAKPTEKKVSTSSRKSSTTKKSASKVMPASRKNTLVKPMLEEYYDLPYRYNQTTVKILAQTPTTLFVYWDISDADREFLIKKHGDNVFYDTKPILIVHNTTKNYSFEIEINDFANSWYIRTQEPDCNYVIELGRKDFNKPEEYIHIYSSNNMVSPNDHILFEKTDLGNILFRNVKTNILSSKNFGSLRFINDIDKLYGNVYDIYNKLYNDELNDISNPSSGEFMFKR